MKIDWEAAARKAEIRLWVAKARRMRLEVERDPTGRNLMDRLVEFGRQRAKALSKARTR